MIRIIDGLKYDTDKMELVAKYTYTYGSYRYGSFSACHVMHNKTCQIYKSKNGRYLEIDDGIWIPIAEGDVKKILMAHDVAAYEKIFGEVEEA